MKPLHKNTFLTLVAAAIIGLVGSALHWSRAAADGKAEAKAKTAQTKKSDTKKSKKAKEEPPQIDPMSVNATCYVCHMTFVHEKISSQHFEEKITCVKCHGLSAKHANDENIGATKPDIIYARHEVDKMCEKCHEDHDVPPRDVVARFIKRKLPAKKTPICTDCHGTHRIERAEEEKEKQKAAGKS